MNFRILFLILIFATCFNVSAEDVVIHKVEFEKALELDAKPVTVKYVDTNGNPQNAEKILVEYSKPMKQYRNINGVRTPVQYYYVVELELDSVMIESITTTFKDKSPTNYKRYYIVGPAANMTSNVRTADVPYEKSKLVEYGTTEKIPRKEMQITKNFYLYLKEVCGSQLPCRVVEFTVKDGEIDWSKIHSLSYDLEDWGENWE